MGITAETRAANVIPDAPAGYITSDEAARRTGWNASMFSKSCSTGDIKRARLLVAKNKSMRKWAFPESELLVWLKSPKRRNLSGQPNSIRDAIARIEAGDTGPTPIQKAPRGSLGLRRGDQAAKNARARERRQQVAGHTNGVAKRQYTKRHSKWRGQPLHKQHWSDHYVPARSADAASVVEQFAQAFTALIRQAVKAELKRLGGEE